jgi:two-component system NtrC family response regulator
MTDDAAPLATLLVADDDPAVRESLERALTREGYAVVLAPDGQAALERLQAGGIDLVLSDLRMPGLTGLELLPRAKAVAPEVDFIMLTAFGTVEEAVKAMKEGATDFLTKPFQRAQLTKVVRQALERRALIAQNRALQQRLDALLRQGNIIGVSPAFQKMMELVKKVADSSATVLIQGESGTGKELVARAIHERSSRRNGPFVAVNCAALPETLLESELFGYEKGAFTGANKQTRGKIEFADGGTFFLDEVGDLPVALQAKLLRFLQERVFERIGGREEIAVDVRIVCATHQNLKKLMEEGRFREDLYYRLSEIVIDIPPLRDRPGDPALLAHAFLQKFGQQQGRRVLGFKQDALDAIEAYAWPGNVREIENYIKRAVIMAEGTQVSAADLGLAVPSAAPEPVNLREVRDEAERKAIARVLSRVDGSVADAAQLLGVSRPTLYDLINRHGLKQLGALKPEQE